ncbi:dGTP triphosphohydrolase [Pseudochrobactrum asaccharolyticum]|uniref:dGTPase n=1 Tax=Pseudochrobactrum asaccharolyticum TaxID=354351 RepID=A0A366E4M0_9HYPH|nr:dNTP triphosphohydrolase [Pseudochrobactrum asaccharolyticum]MBX8802034.1 dNTP triphosphohydrolase [Ochrobactrum sp. MR28]MBX8817683.1 dNTP triphosphohydrolase [Ochrobactrum sp. MR31]RBO97257.1 dGTPase [Pseudochrobactrum asaccharolyticum]
MNWTELLCSERLGDKNYQPGASRSIFVQDHDRIVFSAPFRRLANKTQVQPLYEHDHVHHRLIHSIEVSSVGRSLAMKIGHWLEEHGHIGANDVSSIANIVQAACVAHDIGNPPFGHSGEEAMGGWFAERFAAPTGILADIDKAQQSEFIKFEGNAQGFRIITRLEMYRNAGGMRLSKATLGAFTKYPVSASTLQNLNSTSQNDYIGLKKFGLFSSELELFSEVAKAIGLPEETNVDARWWRRHPLVFIVEAADDVCYNIVDLEDAFTTGELPFDTVKKILHEVAGKPNRDVTGYSQAEHIAFLRALSIGKAIDSCFEAFTRNYEEIMAGTFSASLAEAGPLAPLFNDIKKLSRDQIFTARRKTELEVSGRRTIGNVMSGILPVYENLAQVKWDASKLSEHCQQLTRALDLDLRDINSPVQALHALADFTSGMTDRYALRISRMLSGT